ncbi:MAG: DNA-directed RNA polymerase subunit delta [Erysipelotrichaceae bacterium]
MSLPMIDLAFNVLKDNGEAMTFPNLWQATCDQAGYDSEKMKSKISQFYTSLSLDKRFVLLKDNSWDVRDRHTFSETYVDPSEYELEDSSDDEFEDDEEVISED